MARRSSSSKRATGKCRYSALYVGYNACSELPSVDDIADGVRDLVRYGSSASSASAVLPRLALTVDSKGLKVRHAATVVTGARQQRRRRFEDGKDKVRHPLSDILLVGQGVDSDVRAAAGVILYGFDSGTSSWLHLYVYWFDDGGPDTAARFVRQISELIDTPQHRGAVKQLEEKMIASGQLRPQSHRTPVDRAVLPRTRLNGRAADKYARQRLSAAAAAIYRQPEVEMRRQSSWKTSAADDCKWPEHQPRVSSGNLSGGEYIMWPVDEVPPSYSKGRVDQRPSSLNVPTPVASLTSELRARLATGAPILLPPKDYDTMSRSRGNLSGIEERRCANVDIVGGGGPRRSDTSTPQTYL